ncbi:cobyrinate a,c-diamide synthase [Fusobacterium sp.]|uniref:cobyrinate a,c-diamide synthase n=1 Tax=Fusobacterium sp. TaxID=68766 RepID=UPI0026146ACD|nr:cobyrinate a,c-diamide synthase [Fusobacterium sp.]
MKGFIVAGTKSGIGKTTITMGLMKNFKNVSPFKIGPDYIDGRFHEYATGNKSFNLDYFLMGEEGVKYSFFKNKKDISIIEGVMGLYDGLGDGLDNGSTAHISKILGIPIILVVDGEKRSTSIAAEILGYKLFDKEIHIEGVILNRVASEKSYKLLSETIEKYTGITCLGYLPPIKDLKLEERHLGLVQAQEDKNLDEKLNILGEKIKETIDIKKIEELSEVESKINIGDTLIRKDILLNQEFEKLESRFLNSELREKYKNIKIGIAKDEAFSFYYNDNIEFLENLNIEIKYFSPLKDEKIPDDVDCLFFGGGYPENYGEILEKNISMINSIKEFSKDGGVIYGECGGYIYLSKELEDLNENKFKFVGLNDRKFKMKNRLNIGRFGYINVETSLDNQKIMFPAHEFHYSEEIEENQGGIFKASKKDGRTWENGYFSRNILCGYPHIHFFTSQDLIFNLLDRAKNYQERKNRFNFKDLFNFGNFRKGKK